MGTSERSKLEASGSAGDHKVRQGTSDTLPRQWLMLQQLPRAPRRITASELTRHLEANGYSVTKRTVERDLAQLSAQFPIELDDRNKPYGWSWHRHAPAFSLPGMTPLQAAVLLTADAHIRVLLPAHQRDELKPLLEQARRTLAHVDDEESTSWPERVAVVPATQPLIPPKVPDDVLVAVHEAIYRRLQIQVSYRARTDTKAYSYRLHPLGLVVRGTVTYLACRFGDYKDVRTLALHRIHEAEVKHERAVVPKGFRIDSVVPMVSAGFGQGPLIKIELLVDTASAEHLRESPMANDQKITHTDDEDWVCIKATVQHTQQLVWWLRGYGRHIQIKQPLSLRKDLDRM